MDFFKGTGMKRHIPFRNAGTSRDLSQKSFKNPHQSDPYPKNGWREKMKPLKKCTAILLVLLLFIVVPVAASVAFTPDSPQVIAKGDTFTINGTGTTNGTAAAWVIGRNYFRVSAVTPDNTGNFTVSLNPEVTGHFSSGRYAVVIQDPGLNKKLDIESRVAGNGNITILDSGTIIAELVPKLDIRADAEPVVRIIQAGSLRPGADDILTPYYLLVEEPVIHFDRKSLSDPDRPLPSLTPGEHMVISGTTNMGVENTLQVVIRNLETNTLILTTTIPVIAGRDTNRWIFDLDTTGFSPGEYFVTVGWLKSNTTGTSSTIFSVVAEPDSTMFSIAAGPGSTPEPRNTGITGTGRGGELSLPPLARAGIFLGLVVVGILLLKRKK